MLGRFDSVANSTERATQRPASAAVAVKRPLRVVITTPNGKHGKGGMDRLTQVILQALEAQGDKDVVATRLTTKGRWGKAIGSLVFAAAVARLAWLVLWRKIDLLHINLAAGGSCHRKIILAWIARKAAVPYVVHVHSGRFAEFWNSTSASLARAIDRLLLESAQVVALGRQFEQEALARIPDAKGRIAVLPNATPSRPEHARRVGNRGNKHITCVGLLGPAKGTPQLVEALKSLSARSDWSASLAGNGEVEQTRAMVSSLGLDKRIETPGWLARDDVERLLRRTDIFVLPSFSEGLPMAILEAFSYGIAVIATPLNAIRDVIEEERNGLFVPPGDVPALAKSLERLLSDADLRDRLGANALDDHRRLYTTEVFMDRITALWAKAAARQTDE